MSKHEHITTAQLDEIRARKHDLITIRRAVHEQADSSAAVRAAPPRIR